VRRLFAARQLPLVTSPRDAALYFDADCAFCVKSVRLAQLLGLHCTFAPLQSVDLVALGVDVKRTKSQVPFREADGTVVYGHEAVTAALTTGSLPLRLVGRVLTFGPVDPLSARSYRVIARRRRLLPGGLSKRTRESS
jgi:predicted DCC family thiol-disulfide oxidoreductase YuxK